jgi:gluconate kinase
MLIILFGLSGAGKNFAGEILSKHFNYHFWDADVALPSDMLKAIEKQESFTQKMRDNFTKIIIENISRLKTKYENIVVTQALYKDKNRKQIREAFPGAILIYIKADLEKITVRLSKRNSAIDMKYAKKISLNFEEPPSSQKTIENNKNEEAIIEQLEAFFKQYSIKK